jgi:hypothetical protein
MKLEFFAESNAKGLVNLFCNSTQVWGQEGTKFIAQLDINPKKENTLDVHWICDKVEDVHLHIGKIIISDQKINLLKSFYMPTQQYKKFIKHQVMHQGKMLWPGILRFYWKRINKSQYAERKKTDTTLIRKYNWIYD